MGEEQRAAVMTASACSKEVKPFGPLEYVGAFLPNRGYATAMRNPTNRAIKVSFDFGKCTGYVIHGRPEDDKKVELVVRPGEPWQLAAEFVPAAEKCSFGMSAKMAYA